MNNNEYFQQGVADYFKGVTACPYSMNSPRGEMWSMGWYSAQETEEETYPINHDEVDEETLKDYNVSGQIAQDLDIYE